MQPDVTVLAARGKCLSARVYGDRVERSEMAADAADLLLKDLVPEASLKLALPLRGGRYRRGVLAAAKDDLEGCERGYPSVLRNKGGPHQARRRT